MKSKHLWCPLVVECCKIIGPSSILLFYDDFWGQIQIKCKPFPILLTYMMMNSGRMQFLLVLTISKFQSLNWTLKTFFPCSNWTSFHTLSLQTREGRVESGGEPEGWSHSCGGGSRKNWFLVRERSPVRLGDRDLPFVSTFSTSVTCRVFWLVAPDWGHGRLSVLTALMGTEDLREARF